MNPLFLILITPFIGALAALVAPKKTRPYIFSGVLALETALAVILSRGMSTSRPASIKIDFSRWLDISFSADGLSTFVALVFSFCGLLICLFSLSQAQELLEKKHFYAWMSLFTGAVVAALFSTNLILLFFFLETAALCVLIEAGVYGREELKFKIKNLFVSIFSLLLIVISLVYIYFNNSTLQFDLLAARPLNIFIAFLLCLALLLKTAQAAYLSARGLYWQAALPQAVFLGTGVMTCLSAYIFARVFLLTFGDPALFYEITAWTGVILLFGGAAFAWLARDIKKIIYFCAFSQFGYILLSLSSRSDVSFRSALVYLAAQALALSGLFLCVDRVIQRTGKKNADELGGLIKYMPYTAAGFLMCTFSIVGIPPFLGFWPKFMNVLSSVQEGHIALEAMAVAGALWTLFYLVRLFNKVFLGEAAACIWQDRPNFADIIVLVIAGLCLVLGLLPGMSFDFLKFFIKI